MMPFSRGDVVKLLFPRLDANRGPKKRYALVLSANSYNDCHDHGVMVALSASALAEPAPGVYLIYNWKALELPGESAVVPWLWTLEWSVVVEKISQMSPYQLERVLERLREVVTI